MEEAEAIDKNQFKYFSRFEEYNDLVHKLLNPEVAAKSEPETESEREHGPMFAAHIKIAHIVRGLEV